MKNTKEMRKKMDDIFKLILINKKDLKIVNKMIDDLIIIEKGIQELKTLKEIKI